MQGCRPGVEYSRLGQRGMKNMNWKILTDFFHLLLAVGLKKPIEVIQK
jgi:hypothetical protein